MIVVDSQGNEYEATYPKRAKGLVKSGRARFVGENKICLACPPDDNLEDNIMENNKNTVETTATVQDELGFSTKDIFDQITALQKELAEKHTLYRMGEALSYVFENAEYDDDDARNEAISNITAVFSAREDNLRYLLSMYKELLNIIIFNLK